MNNIQSIQKIIVKDHPQFTDATFQLNEEGWDNLVLIANEEVVFRVPRNKVSREQLLVEHCFLPEIAKISPLPVPEVQYLSQQNGLYAGYQMISGVPFERHILETCNTAQRKQSAVCLGRFLSCLHQFSYEEHENGLYTIRRQNRQAWLDLQAEVLRKAGKMLNESDRNEIEVLFDFILNDIDFDSLPKCLIHGDFSSDHILFDERQMCISGVIDFGDIMLGDPAYDISGILLCYGREFLDQVLMYYEPLLDADFMLRVEKFYVPKVPLHRLLYGIDQGDEEIIYLSSNF
ncbi:MAG: aminoglycoside phosphotransferase family protein [Anaerolineaceae bacterium]|nr:aminoglycoside phosphotransferase family protein [Anaerolineaceae bacterium]